MTNTPLFRLAAVKQQANRLDGEVLIAQPLSTSVLTASLVLMVIAIVSFLACSDFNRKATVSGYLQPDIGLAKVHASRAGIISEIYIKDGAAVTAGQPLIKLIIPEYLTEGSSLIDNLSLSLQQQQLLLKQRREQLQAQYQQQQQELTERLTYHQSVLNELQQQSTLLQQRWQIQQNRFAKLNQLKEQGVLSKVDWQLQQENVLQMQQQIAEQNASKQTQLAAMAQLSGQLQAILLVPTRAYDFVSPGQRTRLRFDAFPYQRFGLYEGEVLKTGQAIILPNEIEMPIAIQEPVYRVAVALDAQEIRAYGSSVPLQSGMLLSADIVLEQRSLLSWLLEPILSLQGRL